MSPDRWQRVQSIFVEVIELPDQQRTELLDQACGGDQELREQLGRMVEAHFATGAAVDRPAVSQSLFSSILRSTAFQPGDLASGRFRVGRLLGEGGMGQVFEALDEQTGQAVAVKALRPQFAHEPKLLARFQQEMRLLERVTHPNVCRVLHHAADATPVHFVMELLVGETLAEYLKREGSLSPPRALAIIRQLVAALDAAHAAGIVHRDFKPGNIMLCGDRAVVTDFGVARAERKLDDETALTTTGGLVMGTPAYMAPEQIEGRAATAAADIYALGGVFYEMLTGELPYAGATPLVLIARKLRETATPVRSRLPNIDRRWDEAIQRCLAPRPEDRFAKASDLLPMLEGSTVARLATWASNHHLLVRRASFAAILAAVGAAGWIGYDQGTRYRPLAAAEALYRQGLAAEDDGSLERAAKLFQQAVAADGRHALAHAHLAATYQELDQLDQARDETLRVDGLMRELRLSGNDLRELEAVRQMILREHARAATLYAEMAAASQGREQQRFQFRRAVALERSNQSIEALRILEQLPEEANTLAMRALLVSRLRKPDDALWEKAVAKAPDAAVRARIVFEQVAAQGGRKTLPARRALLESVMQPGLSAPLQATGDMALARIEVDEGRFEQARRRTETAVQTALGAGADALAANGKIDLSEAFSTQHEYEEALTVVTEALQMAQRNRNRLAEARAKLTLSRVLVRLGKPAEAKPLETAALAFYRDGGFRQHLAAAAVTIANRLIEESKTDRAKFAEVLQYANEALALSQQAGDREREATALGCIMHVQLLESDFPALIQTARRQAAIQVSFGRPPNLIVQVFPLYSLGREKEALAMLDQESAQRKRVAGVQPRPAFREVYNRALIAFQNGQMDEALRWIDLALTFERDVANPISRTRAFGIRLAATTALGRADEKARTTLTQAASLPPGEVSAQAQLSLTEAAFLRQDWAEVRRLAPAALEASRMPLSLDRSLAIAWMAEQAGVPGAPQEARDLLSRMTKSWPVADREGFLARPYVRRMRGQ